MAILRRLLVRAVTELTSNPRVRAKVTDVVEHEVKPRVAATWRQTKPKIEAARDDLRDIARETDPRKDPKAFAAKVRERFFDRGTDT
ncbi:MAG: hypothetical protein ACR2PO_02215 [Methyloligellaceae bacterium]